MLFLHCRLSANWWSSIKDLKDKICSLTHEPPSRQHIFHSTNPVELHNNQILHDLGIEKSGRMLRVAIDYRTRSQFTLTPTKGVLIDDACKEMLRSVRLGLQRNRKPKITDEFEGSGGVYFLRSANGAYEAVFKPHDEEQGMPANPKDHVGAGKEGLREYFQPGQGCLRELAAYIMDYKNFCRVPATTLVHCEHQGFHYPVAGSKVGSGDPYPKLGSLQHFIHGAELFEDLGQGKLSDIEVQKIALLDMRILNCDRNAANILVKYNEEHEYHGTSKSDNGDDHITFESASDSEDCKCSPHSSPIGGPNKSLIRAGSNSRDASVYELYPIDHGYAMPSRLKIFEWDWAWLYYPQVDRAVAPEIVAYMESLNIDELLHKLEPQVPLSDDSVFLLRLSHYLLLQGVRAGLTLKDIAMIIARADEDVASKLELSVEEAEENAYRSIELKSSSRIKGSNSIAPSWSQKNLSSKDTSNNSSPRSTVDVTPVKYQSGEEVPEFPVAISLDLLRAKEDEQEGEHGQGTGEASSCCGDCDRTDKINCNERARSSSRNCEEDHVRHRVTRTISDEHTTHESDSSTWSDRSSPNVTCESSHAVNHSPMRPILSSSSSWNSFTSFHTPQPALHSYTARPKEQHNDTSLGMSPRRTDVKSKYLPAVAPAIVVNGDISSSLSRRDAANSQGSSQSCNHSGILSLPSPPRTNVLPREEPRLGTIVEYARERGLSSMSNSSTVSHESDGCWPPEQQHHRDAGSVRGGGMATIPPQLSTIPSGDVEELSQEACSTSSSICGRGSVLMQSNKSCDSLGGVYVDLEPPSPSDHKHTSLPGNALRRMGTISPGYPAHRDILPVATEIASATGTDHSAPMLAGVSFLPSSAAWTPPEDQSLPPEDQSLPPVSRETSGNSVVEPEVAGIHVDLGIPLYRSQRSIDSSLGPVVYDRGMNSWAPDMQKFHQSSSASPTLTHAAVKRSGDGLPSASGNGGDRGSCSNLLAFSLLGKNKSKSNTSLCSSCSSNDDYSADYGFFKSMKDGEFGTTTSSLGEDSAAAINYGEFSGIDLPATSGEGEGGGNGGADFDGLCAPLPSLTRVVSFSGFESAPVYNNIFAGTMGNLRLERRKVISKTKEFRQLRLLFAEEHISAIIHRMKREKGGSR